jgi:hypothetical protein
MKKPFLIITGISDIDRRLRTLEPRIQKKVARKALRNGIKIMTAEVKSQVPVKSGLTKANVKTRAAKRKKRGIIEIETTIRSIPGLKKVYRGGQATVFYPAVVEYKHDAFMRRSFVAKGPIVRQKAIDELRSGAILEATKGP